MFVGTTAATQLTATLSTQPTAAATTTATCITFGTQPAGLGAGLGTTVPGLGQATTALPKSIG